MGNIDIPTQNPRQVYKCPVSAYEFGATVVTNKVKACAAVGPWADVMVAILG